MPDIRELLSQAIGLHSTGQLDQAQVIYESILTQSPNNPDALNLLGVLATQRQDYQNALDLIQKALTERPDHPVILLNLGNAFRGLNKLDEAAECYQKAITLKPDFADAQYNLGIIYRDQQKLTKAVESLRLSLKYKPELHDANLVIAEVYRNQGNSRASEACLDAVSSHGSLPPDVLMRTGAWYMIIGIIDKAENCFRRVVAYNPADSKAYNALGLACYSQTKLVEALGCFKKSIELAAKSADPYFNMAAALVDLGSPAEAEEFLLKGLELEPRSHHAHSYLAYCQCYMHDRTPQQVFESHLAWAQAQTTGIQVINPSIKDRIKNHPKLRIGYVSGDFRIHSVAYFMEAILVNHNKNHFEIYCYSDDTKPDEITKRFKSLGHTWREITGKSDDAVAKMVCDDKIDILVDLAGHTRDNRLMVFARKPAPIQVAYLGYPNTTSLSTIDYRLTDAYADPPGASESFYTEKLVRLPGSFLCYTPPSDVPSINPAIPSNRNGHITFGCFNNLAKVTPIVVDAWAQILKQIPNSHLIIKSKPFNDSRVVSRWKELFAGKGIDADRLRFMGKVISISNHLSVYNDIDVAIDTFPYNGTTTTFEALWMGVPVITIAGHTHASRVGVSILTNAGLQKCIASSIDDYIRLAVDISDDFAWRLSMRKSLRETMASSVLCDAPQFTRKLEDAYTQMWNSCKNSI